MQLWTRRLSHYVLVGTIVTLSHWDGKAENIGSSWGWGGMLYLKMHAELAISHWPQPNSVVACTLFEHPLGLQLKKRFIHEMVQVCCSRGYKI